MDRAYGFYPYNIGSSPIRNINIVHLICKRVTTFYHDWSSCSTKNRLTNILSSIYISEKRALTDQLPLQAEGWHKRW